MAFKKKYTAFCDDCNNSIDVWAKCEADANRLVRKEGWSAIYGVELYHTCSDCIMENNNKKEQIND